MANLIKFILWWCATIILHCQSLESNVKKINWYEDYKKKCKIELLTNYYEIECPSPKFGTVFLMERKSSDNTIRIECIKNNNKFYEYFTDIQMDNVETVIFYVCPLPYNGTTFSSILNRLGLKRIAQIEMTLLSESILTKQYLRDLDTLQHLRIIGDGRIYISDDLFDSFDNLTSLEVNYSNISLTEKTFWNMKKLQILDLKYNAQLNAIGPNVFKNQNQLRTLTMSDNNLYALTKDSFNGAPSIEILVLAENNLTNISENTFSSLTNLKSIYLRNNNIANFPQKLFQHNKNLEKTSIIELNNLKTLPTGFLSHLNNLKNVTIEHCQLNAISSDLFEGSTNIKSLSFKSNNLEQLPPHIFAKLKNMVNLDLSYNKLNTIDDNIFQHLNALLDLSLSNNFLTRISE